METLWQLTISQLAAFALLPSQRAQQASEKKGGKKREGGGGAKRVEDMAKQPEQERKRALAES